MRFYLFVIVLCIKVLTAYSQNMPPDNSNKLVVLWTSDNIERLFEAKL